MEIEREICIREQHIACVNDFVHHNFTKYSLSVEESRQIVQLDESYIHYYYCWDENFCTFPTMSVCYA